MLKKEPGRRDKQVGEKPHTFDTHLSYSNRKAEGPSPLKVETDKKLVGKGDREHIVCWICIPLKRKRGLERDNMATHLRAAK